MGKRYRKEDDECVNGRWDDDECVDDGDGMMTTFWIVKMGR